MHRNAKCGLPPKQILLEEVPVLLSCTGQIIRVSINKNVNLGWSFSGVSLKYNKMYLYILDKGPETCKFCESTNRINVDIPYDFFNFPFKGKPVEGIPTKLFFSETADMLIVSFIPLVSKLYD